MLNMTVQSGQVYQLTLIQSCVLCICLFGQRFDRTPQDVFSSDDSFVLERCMFRDEMRVVMSCDCSYLFVCVHGTVICIYLHFRFLVMTLLDCLFFDMTLLALSK